MSTRRKPNIVLIYADDLGRGMLSCYGQRIIETPNIDRIASGGMRFTRSYGCVLCAPARASMLMGMHDCHAGAYTFNTAGIYKKISTGEMAPAEIAEVIHTTGLQARPGEVFLAEVARRAGYVTGEIGKLEWGFATTAERIRRHGWDYHFGYYDHQRCHGFFPPFLFEDGELVEIAGNTHVDCGKGSGVETPANAERRHDMRGKAVYSQDLFEEKILQFLRSHRDEPFFLFHPSQLPHGPICVPEVHGTARRAPGLTEFEREYASMVLRLDDTVGLILDELDRLGLTENTLVMFCADNGHEVYAIEAGRCSGGNRDLNGVAYDNVETRFYSELSGDVFNGNGSLAGLKRSSWEGGTRIPFVARWPGRIAEGCVSDRMIANYDLLPTVADLVGGPTPEGKDGISFAPELLGDAGRPAHEYVVTAANIGPALVTDDGWKLRRLNERDAFQLYDLNADPREERDLAGDNAAVVRRLADRLLTACDGSYQHGTTHHHRVQIDLEALPSASR